MFCVMDNGYDPQLLNKYNRVYIHVLHSICCLINSTMLKKAITLNNYKNVSSSYSYEYKYSRIV